MKLVTIVRSITLAAVATLLLSTALAQDSDDVAAITGIWLGALAPAPGVEMRILITLSPDDAGTLTGTMKSIDQGSPDIPLSEATYSGGRLFLGIRNAGIEIEGSLDTANDQLRTEFRQGGGTFPLMFSRVNAPPEISRPQEPVPPYPYSEEEVTYRNDAADITFAGTLTMPRTGGPFPAVVLLTGSGQQTRDEEVFGHKPFLVLADYLTRRGYAVLRADDRGIGGSGGNFAASTTADFASDALAGMAYLKGRDEIDEMRIGLLGHSEGGMIAPIAAAQSPDVAFVVLIAAPGQRFADIVLYQQRHSFEIANMTAGQITEILDWNRQVFDIAGSDRSDQEAEAAIRALFSSMTAEQRTRFEITEESVAATIRQQLQPWWRYAMTYDAPAVIRQIGCPVLAVNGEKDRQVPAAENLAIIESALADGGNGDYTVTVLPGLNHLLQTAVTGHESEYAQIAETISPTALKVIGDWLAAR